MDYLVVANNTGGVTVLKVIGGVLKELAFNKVCAS